MTTGRCKYCLCLGAEEFSDTGSIVCIPCRKILSNPETGIRLIKGHMILTLRGSMAEEKLRLLIHGFMIHFDKMGRP